MKQIFTSILIVAVLAGCGTKGKSDKTVTKANANQLVLPQPYSPATGALPSPNQVSTVPVNTAPTNTPSQAAGLNPAHGQPGHRCDISVGAPLNSSPTVTVPTPNSTGQTTTTISQPIITTTGTNPPALNFNPTTAAKTVTAPGMNPPHGEPGHVCGTPVGSPLNGKTAPTTNQTTTLPISTSNPFTSLKADQAPATKVVTAPGMNPPHGEPGHVCGTPVGSPLNGKTADTKGGKITPSIVAAADSSKN